MGIDNAKMGGMETYDLNETIARNLARFMAEPGMPSNANALSVKTGGKVSPQTIRNLLDPRQRWTGGKLDGYPKIDTLQAVLEPLGRSVWELLHPDIEHAEKAWRAAQIFNEERLPAPTVHDSRAPSPLLSKRDRHSAEHLTDRRKKDTK